MLKIDVSSHMLPPRYMEALYAKTNFKPFATKFGITQWPTMHDIDARLRLMDRYPGYVQILNITIPPLEDVAPPAVAAELAKMANDEMAELVMRYPDRFVAAIACLPMNDMDACLKEIDRAIVQLRFRGIQITSNIMDREIDSPEFEPLFEKMNYYNLPIFIHPRTMKSGPRAFSPTPESIAKDEAGYWSRHLFNWQFETTLCMGRLVFSGLLEKYPDLTVVTHHLGGYVPYQAGRITALLDRNEMRADHRPGRYFRRRPEDYYKMLYGDTAVYGNTSALMCGLAFFGIDRVVFGTDMPWDSQDGERLVRETIRSVDEMAVSLEDRKKIYEDNARRIFRLPM